jgi:SAM-dependent methyltransferase
MAIKRLKSLGVKVIDVGKLGPKLPFRNEKFALVLNRHDAFNAKEVFRVLNPEGTFLTQQVGGGNLKELEEVFNVRSGYMDWTLNSIKNDLTGAGFHIKYAKEAKIKVEFKDVGAIVYFLKAIPWCVPGFSVEKNLRQLEKLQKKLESGKKLVFTEVRYIVMAKKIT